MSDDGLNGYFGVFDCYSPGGVCRMVKGRCFFGGHGDSMELSLEKLQGDLPGLFAVVDVLLEELDG